MELFIHHEASPYVRKVLLVCEELGVQLKECKVDWTSPNAMAAFREINPNGKFPALRNRDLVIWESNAIIIYLAQHYKARRMVGRDAETMARVNQWLFWELAHFAAVANPLASARMGNVSPLSVPEEALFEEFRRLCAVVDRQLLSQSYLADDEPTLPDFAIAADLTYVVEADLPVADYANLAAWFDRMRERESWRSTEERKNRALAS